MGEGVLSAIAARVGTPVYVYDAGIMRERYTRLAAALAPVRHRIHYAIKANGNLAILRLFRALGAGADIVSGGELARARSAGFAPQDLVFSGAGKTADELRAALTAGVGVINLESAREAALLAALAEERGVGQAVAIRVNPDVAADTHPYTRTGELGMKFGIPVAEVSAVAEAVAASPQLVLVGLALHIGSQILSPQPFRRAALLLVDLAVALRQAGHQSLRVLDLGGGIGVSYAGEEELDPARYADAVVEPVRAAGFALAAAPGRYLVATAGVLLTRVLYRKESGGRRFLIVDAGMTDLLRPSHYQAHHEVTVVSPDAARRPRELVDVVGPACETGDFLALARSLPCVAEGDLLAVQGAGAYGFVMASNYNARPRPAEVLLEGDRWAVVRERERVETLMAGETAEPGDWRDVASA